MSFLPEPTVNQVIIDGTGHDMTPVTVRAGETVYRYSTTLDLGEHTYAFHFEAEGVSPATTAEAVGPIVGRIVFTMGSSDTTDPDDLDYELGRESDEWQHTVVLTDSVRTRLLEVSQAEWVAAGLVDPSHFDGDDLPVESITWFDAVAYCNAQSQSDGLTAAYTINGDDVTWNQAADGWRLPTEAEWEYLCRAGSTTAFCNGRISALVCSDDPVLNAVGWYCGSFGGGETQGTQDVGGKLPNDWGIYDMHGNVLGMVLRTGTAPTSSSTATATAWCSTPPDRPTGTSVWCAAAAGTAAPRTAARPTAASASRIPPTTSSVCAWCARSSPTDPIGRPALRGAGRRPTLAKQRTA